MKKALFSVLAVCLASVLFAGCTLNIADSTKSGKSAAGAAPSVTVPAR